MRFSSRVDHIGGGAVAAWDIHNAAQAAKRRGEDVIVGVNKYKLASEDTIEARDIDNMAVREGQIARLQKIKSTRDNAAVKAALEALTFAAGHGEIGRAHV